MKRSDSITNLAKAMAAAQGEMKSAPKDAYNPHFRSNYADLDAIISVIREPLAKNGLAFSQEVTNRPFETGDGKSGIDTVCTTLIMHASGEWMEHVYVAEAQRRDIQGLGSNQTYARRYALSAAFGVSAGVGDTDDDGERAVGRGEPPAAAARRASSRSSRNGQAEGANGSGALTVEESAAARKEMLKELMAIGAEGTRAQIAEWAMKHGPTKSRMTAADAHMVEEAFDEAKAEVLGRAKQATARTPEPEDPGPSPEDMPAEDQSVHGEAEEPSYAGEGYDSASAPHPDAT